MNSHFQSGAFNSSSYDQYQVESILLDDGTVIDLLNDLSFVGTANADYIYGTNGDDVLYGLSGNDSLYGNGGDDVLNGGTGNDNLNGGTGDDSYVWSVGDGNDTISEAGGLDQLVLHGVLETDIRIEKYNTYSLRVHVGDETITVNSHFQSDAFNSSSYDQYQVESILLDDGTVIDLLNDLSFVGTANADYLYGTNGSDQLYGNNGSDYLYGGNGNDVLYGGEGVDMLYGQSGADTFVFESGSAFLNSDSIQDFKISENDKLDISDLIVGYDPLTDAITDFVQITESGANSYLSVDADGGADNFIQVGYIYNETGLTDEGALEANGTLITV